MQEYNRFEDTEYISDAPSQLNKNMESIATDFSGASFPTENLFVGMKCLRTDENKIYRLYENASNQLVWQLEYTIIDGGIKVEQAINDANGKDITAYIAKLEKDSNDDSIINIYNGADTKVGSITVATAMVGATTNRNGKAGNVPQPLAGDQDKVLHGDGSWRKAVGFESYWEAGETVQVGDVRYPTGRENSGVILECVEAGTTGSKQPEIVDGNEIANYSDLGRVGQVRVIFNLAEKDVDEILATGVTYSRLTYSELWDYAQSRPALIITEAEWQQKYAETNGKFVPYYSSGDGSSTFRTPLLGAYLKGAETASDVGKWLDAGLPNIDGQENLGIGDGYGALLKYPSGAENSALYAVKSEGINHYYVPSSYNNNLAHTNILGVDASRSNPIYGNSDTVTPETMTGIWVIKAVGVVVDSGETDIAQVLQGVEETQSRVSVAEDNTSGITDYIVESYENGTSWYKKYKSGWVVQGGREFTKVANRLINFIVPMQKPVSIQISPLRHDYLSSASIGMGGEIIYGNTDVLITTTGFQTKNENNTGVIWEAKGYV